MQEEIKRQTIEEMMNYHLPRYDEIPNVGLYLDQVTKYIKEYIDPFDDMQITSSMISNYVKKNLVDNPVKKLYYRHQIAYLIFIAMTKSTLSMDKIQILIDLQKETADTKATYDYFCEEFEHTLQAVFKGDDVTKGDLIYSDEKTMLRNTIIAIVHKIYLDRCFKLMN